jgi:hypothetical protein
VVLAELREPANDNFRQVWLDDLAREAFREFAYCDEAVEGIVFCEHVERWKRGMVPGATRKLAPPQKLLEEARRIYVRYLDPDPEARKTIEVERPRSVPREDTPESLELLGAQQVADRHALVARPGEDPAERDPRA